MMPDDVERPVWTMIRKLSDKIGEKLTGDLRAIAR
jgi:type I restriction enzyme M protein